MAGEPCPFPMHLSILGRKSISMSQRKFISMVGTKQFLTLEDWVPDMRSISKANYDSCMATPRSKFSQFSCIYHIFDAAQGNDIYMNGDSKNYTSAFSYKGVAGYWDFSQKEYQWWFR